MNITLSLTAAAYYTLHGTWWSRDEHGNIIEGEDIPEISRAVTIGNTITFSDLPEGDVNHIAGWDDTGRLLFRAGIFAVPDFPELRMTRYIDKGCTVTVKLDHQ